MTAASPSRYGSIVADPPWAHENQTVAAYGRPNSAREAGKLAVERHAEALRRLADA